MGWTDGWCFAFHISVEELVFMGSPGIYGWYWYWITWYMMFYGELWLRWYCWWKKYEKILLTTVWMYKSLKTNRINYQPQLVQDFFHQQYWYWITWYLYHLALWSWYWCHNIHFNLKNMPKSKLDPFPDFRSKNFKKTLKRNHRDPLKLDRNI